MDPFNGLGSTAIACARLGIDFIGSDIDETYLKDAIERLGTDAADQDGRRATPRELPAPGTARMRKAALDRRRARRTASAR
jgi:site-specific DNA-methyltransferase (adenine-specific)